MEINIFNLSKKLLKGRKGKKKNKKNKKKKNKMAIFTSPANIFVPNN